MRHKLSLLTGFNAEDEYENIPKISEQGRTKQENSGYEDMLNEVYCHVDDSDTYDDLFLESDYVNSSGFNVEDSITNLTELVLEYDNSVNVSKCAEYSLDNFGYDGKQKKRTISYSHDQDNYEELFSESAYVKSAELSDSEDSVTNLVNHGSLTEGVCGTMEKQPGFSDKKDIRALTGNLNMQQLEQFTLETVCIRRIHEHLYYFDNHVFRPLDKRKFLRLMRERLPDEIVRSISSFAKLEEVYKFLDTNTSIELAISEEMSARAKRLIVFYNGLYDAEQQSLLPFSKRYPVFFEINACYLEDDRDCKTPEFDKFLEHISQGDKMIKDLVLQMIGYVMLQGVEGKCFFVLGTERNSGKSVLGEFIASLFNDEAVANIPLTSLGERFSLGSIWRKAVNISMDLPTKTLTEEDVSRIKLLTGEMRINTEEKYEPTTTSFVYCKNIFATNGSISLKVNDEAFWDRLVFVPFMYSVDREHQDKELLNKLLKERDGIATKAAKAVHQLILNNFKFPEPDIAKKIVNTWKFSSKNSIELFINNCCKLSDDVGEFSSDVFYAYGEFCEKIGILPYTQTALVRYILRLPGISKCKKRRVPTASPQAFLEGIKLKH